MTAYLISNYLEVRDPDRLAAYAKLALPAIAEAGGTFLVAGQPAVVHEGGVAQQSVVVSFATVEAAVAAYESPAYQAALEVLGDAVVRDLRIVPGIEPRTPTDRP